MQHCFVLLFVLVVAMEVMAAMGKATYNHEDESNYELLSPKKETKQEQGKCKGACNKILICPEECPDRKPNDKKKKGCFINCGIKCEATCKRRKPDCDGYGSVCYDPRFVGGDGTMFYFHGSKGGDFALVSDKNLHINAHFIGTRPSGRTRDYTWVQAVSIMFDTHTLDIAANKVSKWDDKIDSLTVKWNGKTIHIPADGEAEWKTNGEDREVVVERTDYTNSLKVTIKGLLELDVKVTPIGKEENRVHNYQLPSNDAFAHLETQFRFKGLTDQVEGVLGKTYRPDYVSSVKKGVDMPIMGGEDKYCTKSFHSTVCNACKFQRPSGYKSDA
ncbi:unnamed protein product [Rhodiola kirilowii]